LRLIHIDLGIELFRNQSRIAERQSDHQLSSSRVTMKFGATLSRRSVPQWRTHDLDYVEIKLLIKQQTSSKEGCSREFEKNLLTVLDSELERVRKF